MQQVTNDFKLLQDFVKEQNAQGRNIKNMFLENVYVGQDRLGVPTLNFRGGVNMHSEDHQQIALDFRKLNRFHIENGKVTYATDVTPYSKTKLQEDLVTYAVVAYGLSYGSSNYSLYIPPSFIKPLDKQLTENLNDLVVRLQDNPSSLDTSLLDHLKLSYVGQNVSRLPFPDYKQIEITYKGENSDKRRNGKTKDTVKEGSKFIEKEIFFDLKVKTDKKAPNWYKEGSGNRMVAYRKVAESPTHAYYQRIGKVKDLNYTKLRQNTYKISDYFTPDIYTLPLFFQEGNVGYSNTPTSHFLNKGDLLYVIPFYNYDRTERKLMRLVSSEKLSNAKYPGYKYVLEEVEEVKVDLSATEQTEIDQVLKEKDKGCKSSK